MPIVTIPIVSRALGPDGLGTFGFIHSVVQYFVMFAGLGLAIYGIRGIAIARENKEKLSRKFWELQTFNMIIATVVIIVYFAFALMMNEMTYYLIMSMVVFATLFDISWFYRGIEDFKLITLVGSVIKICSFLAIVLFIRTEDDLMLYFIIQSVSMLTLQCSLWLFLFKNVDFVKVSFKDAMSHFKPALEYFAGRAATTFYTNLSNIILGLLASITLVGIFSSSMLLIIGIITLLTTLDKVMFPRITKMIQDKELDQVDELLGKTIHFQLFLTIPATFGLIAISNHIVSWFFGDGFVMVSKVMPALALLIIIMSLGMGAGRLYLFPRNMIKEFNHSVFGGAAVGLLLNISLIPFIGIWGAVIARLLSEIFVTGVRVKSMLKGSDFKFEFKKILLYLISGIGMYLCIWWITRNMEHTPVTTVLQVIIGVSTYFLFTAILRVNVIFDGIRRIKS
jgi:O-antigen/teichoic acid export membrane protein